LSRLLQLCGVLLIFALLPMLESCKNTTEAHSAGPPPAVSVTVAVATQESVPVELHAIGTVEASAVIQVKSQVAGELTKVHFVEGGYVNQGDLLFEIDQRPYQDALRQAEAAVSRDQAQLNQAQANVARDVAQSKNAESDAARYEQLVKEGVVPRSQSDQYRTTADALRESTRADEAAIESARAALQSDRAAEDRAKLDLTFCQVRSPVSGRAGNLLVHAGNLVKANGDNAVVVINQVMPIWVSFAIPEQQLAAIRRNSASRKLPVDVSARDIPGQRIRGFLSVIDNIVDTNSGTIHLKATFENCDRVLWPGQYVNVLLVLDTTNNATLVPSEAVQAGQRGQMIFVVKPDQTVDPRPVTVGAVHGNKVIIEKGISPGETVVTDGQLLLSPGAHVRTVAASKVDSQVL
jgi:multidrug efflux system membrane fusion protein